MRLAILLAARNEEARLERCLASLRPFLDAGDALVVADDGSSDATADIAERSGATKLLRLPGVGRGRAYRKAFDAAPAGADAMLVAQADMAFPPEARDAIAATLRIGATENSLGGAAWGFFRQRIEGGGARLALVEAGNALRAQLGLPYGDQAVFFRRDALERAGGFPDQPTMEDLELALRLRRAFGRPAVAKGRVGISRRHWEGRSVALRTIENWRAAMAYVATRRANGAAEGESARAAPRQEKG